MKTIKICYAVHPYYCPKCKKLYFSEVDCDCDEREMELKEKPRICPKCKSAYWDLEKKNGKDKEVKK